jgi:hypothetical protein
VGWILLVLFLALIFGGLGFVVHALWIISVIVFVFWLAGWAMARGSQAGHRRRWSGRW